jgi:hypothetical protein
MIFGQNDKTFTISGKCTNPNDLKQWNLQIRASDGFSTKDVLQKFSLTVKNNPPTVIPQSA